MRVILASSILLASAACQSSLPPFPEATAGPLTEAELAWSYDSAFHDPIFKNIAKNWDRECTLAKAKSIAASQGDPGDAPIEAKEGPAVFVENPNGGLTAVSMDFSNREFAAAGVIQDAAKECQEEQSS